MTRIGTLLAVLMCAVTVAPAATVCLMKDQRGVKVLKQLNQDKKDADWYADKADADMPADATRRMQVKAARAARLALGQEANAAVLASKVRQGKKDAACYSTDAITSCSTVADCAAAAGAVTNATGEPWTGYRTKGGACIVFLAQGKRSLVSRVRCN